MKLDPATISVLDRMTKALWISGYANDERGLLIEWTPKGDESTKRFRELFDQLGDEMYADELGSLLVIIDTMSAGGTTQRNKV